MRGQPIGKRIADRGRAIKNKQTEESKMRHEEKKLITKTRYPD